MIIKRKLRAKPSTLKEYRQQKAKFGGQIPSKIYTKYLPVDKKAFALQLQTIMAETNPKIQTAKLNKLIKTISNKAVGRMATALSKGKKAYKLTWEVNNPSYSLGKEELADIGTATRAVFNSFAADVTKAEVLGNYNKEAFNTRADLIAECEVARITNKASNYMARDAGLKYWLWGASGSKTPREEHEVLYGKKSLVGETPASSGEFPGELPGCNCAMIFINDS